MANQNRQTLEQYFQTGNSPTQAQFADLIDSGLNQADDSITCDADGQIEIGNPARTANLNVRGKMFTRLSGTLSVKQGETSATGIGTSLDAELTAGDAIQIGPERFNVARVTDATHLELATAATSAIKDSVAYRDANLLLIENGNGDTQFVIDKSGNVGIGLTTPVAKLHVAGKVLATELAGNGSGITDLNAANLKGTLSLKQIPELTDAQIPDLPASKIKGSMNVDQIPLLTSDQIPDLPASRIKGQLQPDQLPPLPTASDVEWVESLKGVISVDDGNAAIGPEPPITELVISKDAPLTLGPVLTLMNSGGGAGSGAAIDFDGWPVPAGVPSTARIQSIDDGNYSSHLSFQTKEPGAPEQSLVERLHINSQGKIGIGTPTPQSQLEIAAQDGLRITGYQPFITLEDTHAGNKSGYVQSADGNLNFIPDSFHAQNSAAMIIEDGSGTVKVLGTLQANQFEGSGTGLTGIPAANITGALNPAQIPPIPASKISGQLTVEQIPNLPPSKITGAVTGQPIGPVGPGGRPLLASGSVSPGSTQNIFAIPTTPFEGSNVGVYSLEIYTTYWWQDWGPIPGGVGFEGFGYTVMTRTVLAGTVLITPQNPVQIESMIVSPTQTNHPEPKFPTVSCAIVSDNGQAWLQMQTTTGHTRLAPDTPPGMQAPQVMYYVYSLI